MNEMTSGQRETGDDQAEKASELEGRFQTIGTKVLYQERTVDELNSVVTAQQNQIDELLDENGAPSVGRLLLDARMSQLLAGQGAKQKVEPREMVRSLPELRDQIQADLKTARESKFSQEELPAYDRVWIELIIVFDLLVDLTDVE